MRNRLIDAEELARLREERDKARQHYRATNDAYIRQGRELEDYRLAAENEAALADQRGAELTRAESALTRLCCPDPFHDRGGAP